MDTTSLTTIELANLY